MLLNSQSWARVIFFHDLSASLYHVVLSNMYSASPFTTVFIQYLYSSMMFRVLNHHFSNCQNLFFKFQCRPFPPLLAVNLHPSSWWSTSTPPGSQPPSLMAVNFNPSLRSTYIPSGSHLPFLLAVNFHPSWQLTSIPCGRPLPPFVAVNLHLFWQLTSTLCGGQPSSLPWFSTSTPPSCQSPPLMGVQPPL